jgi:hypothetical protein
MSDFGTPKFSKGLLIYMIMPVSQIWNTLPH